MCNKKIKNIILTPVHILVKRAKRSSEVHILLSSLTPSAEIDLYYKHVEFK